MTLPSTLSNILIDGNTFEGDASFSYDLLAEVEADARITNNYFAGIKNNPSFGMIYLLGSSCNVRGNTFIRGTNSIPSYINILSSSDQIIVDNIFDGYTTDGTNTLLVNNLSKTSTYTQNKNQVGYAIIPLGANKPAVANASNASFSTFAVYNAANLGSLSSTYGVAGGAFYDDYVLEIWEATVSPGQNYFSTGVDISSHIPVGAKVIDAKFSVFNPSSITLNTSGTNTFTLALAAGRNHTNSIDTKTYSSSGKTTWMLGFNAVSTLTINSGNEANMRSAFQPVEIPTLNFTGVQFDSLGNQTSVNNADISSNYVAGNDYGLTAKLVFEFEASAAGSYTSFLPLIVVSPLIITYVF